MNNCYAYFPYDLDVKDTLPAPLTKHTFEITVPFTLQTDSSDIFTDKTEHWSYELDWLSHLKENGYVVNFKDKYHHPVQFTNVYLSVCFRALSQSDLTDEISYELSKNDHLYVPKKEFIEFDGICVGKTPQIYEYGSILRISERGDRYFENPVAKLKVLYVDTALFMRCLPEIKKIVI